jgi:hypothetical protein
LYCKIESNTLMRPKALEKSNSSPWYWMVALITMR